MKQCAITSELLTQTIENLRADYETEGISAEGINNGWCADFATVIWERLSNSNDLHFEDLYVDGSGHTWLSFNGKHYDAECSQGVKDCIELPFFQRNKELVNALTVVR